MEAYTSPRFFGVVRLEHSPKIFALSIIVFTLIYWWMGPTHFYDNISRNGTDFRGIRVDFKNDSIFDYAYFAIVVQSLLGFGDIIPATRVGRLCVCTQILISMYLLLTTGSAILFRKK